MLEYLIQLPYETMGQNMLGYLELNDIIQFEKAAASNKSQQLLNSILPYSPPFVVNHFKWKLEAINWFIKRRCCVKHAQIPVDSLCGVDFQHYIFNDIELQVQCNAPMKQMEALKIFNMISRVSYVKIEGKQNPTVMEELFALFSNSINFRRIDIKSSNLSQWMEYLKKIGPYLLDISIDDCDIKWEMITTITEHSPYLQKLSFKMRYCRVLSGNNILQSIANNCPHLRSLDITVNFIAVYDLTAFAEKCPQLEELSLNCQQLTDQSVVIAIAQHCSRLKKLKLNQCKFTATLLIALSERGLPLEELIISPSIPILSAEIAAQCAHALSQLFRLSTVNYLDDEIMVDYSNAIQYMTGLREIELSDSWDHLLVPHLLLLLEQCCAGLERLTIYSDSSITPEQICELVVRCCNLKILSISKSTCISDAVIVVLASSCPHLQEITLNSSEMTEEGVLALAAHCRQLREIHVSYTALTEETVRQLAYRCPHLTKLRVRVKQRDDEYTGYTNMKLTKRDIKAIREYA